MQRSGFKDMVLLHSFVQKWLGENLNKRELEIVVWYIGYFIFIEC